MILHGRNVNVKVNGVIIACCKACKINISCDITEIANPSSGTWKQWLAGRKEWDVEATMFLVDVEQDYGRVGQTVSLEFGEVSTADRSQLVSSCYGSAIVTMYAMSGEVKGLATAQMQFKGNGSLT